MKTLIEISGDDMIELQWMAARYAHDRNTFASDTVNRITAKMILSGIYPKPDITRKDDENEHTTIWAKDGQFGWPMELIERYGWDGRKQRKDKR